MAKRILILIAVMAALSGAGTACHHEIKGVARYGQIVTQVKPDSALVYVDGKYYGRARDFARRIDSLTVYPGTHKVDISAEGYKTYSEEISVNPGGLVPIVTDLQPLH
ncbi:MAG: PEGA domain-containing protein [Nitrospirota bacterium]